MRTCWKKCQLSKMPAPEALRKNSRRGQLLNKQLEAEAATKLQ